MRRLLAAHRYAYVGIKRRAVARFVWEAARCREIQRRVLFEKLRANAESDFGREHHLAKVQTIEDFRKQVPVAGYEYYRPYVERVKRGEINAMFGPGTRVLMFSMTSGTTSQSKYIPITNRFFREYRKAWNVWGLGVYRDHIDLVRKYAIHFGSDWEQFRTSGGIACGNISGLVAETRPRIANAIFLLPALFNKITGTANKHYVALRLAMATPHIGLVGTANPLTLINLARQADSQRECLIRDLYDGSLSEEIEIAPAIRERLARLFARRHRERARQLEGIVERTGQLLPRDVWPDISVVSIWMGSSMGIYLERLRAYYGDVAFRDHGLSASEGHMTTPLQDESPRGLLDYLTHYFEFIPENEHGGDKPTVLEAHELEVDKHYYLLLTTFSGLYRYDIHDVVRCVGFEGTCPVLEFLHKGAQFSSMVGEKLSEFQVAHAVPRALRDAGLNIEHFSLVPVAGDPARYALLLEEELDLGTAQKLANCVDAELARANCEYEDRLTSRRLLPVSVRQVPAGTWAAIRTERVSGEGGSVEQYKHPFLGSRPALVDQLLKLADAAASKTPR